MPPLINFFFIVWYFVRSFALTAHDEIYTFAFLRVLQTGEGGGGGDPLRSRYRNSVFFIRARISIYSFNDI